MGSAAYGQTLLEASVKLGIDWAAESPQLATDEPASFVPAVPDSRSSHGGITLRVAIPAVTASDYIAIRVLGRFGLKGVPDPPVLAVALPRRLSSRTFPLPADLVGQCDAIPWQSVSMVESGGSKRESRGEFFGREIQKNFQAPLSPSAHGPGSPWLRSPVPKRQDRSLQVSKTGRGLCSSESQVIDAAGSTGHGHEEAAGSDLAEGVPSRC
jgi:hypothetical protein